MNNPPFLKSAILEELAQVGPCRIEVLYERLPYYSWSQIHVVVDRLMQEGTIVRKHPIRSLNLFSLAPHHTDQPRDAA